MNKRIFVIEHLEPKLSKWCLIEYTHISEIVGKKNLWFCNVKNKKETEKLRKIGRVFEKGVAELNLERVCVLDPESHETLKPSDAEKFDYFVFGGILGDYPPRKRTKKELTDVMKMVGMNFEIKNIGKKQMSTDNAIFAVNDILNGKKFDELKFKDNFKLQINDIESVELPFRYNLVNGRPLISEKIITLLKRKKGF